MEYAAGLQFSCGVLPEGTSQVSAAVSGILPGGRYIPCNRARSIEQGPPRISTGLFTTCSSAAALSPAWAQTRALRSKRSPLQFETASIVGVGWFAAGPCSDQHGDLVIPPLLGQCALCAGRPLRDPWDQDPGRGKRLPGRAQFLGIVGVRARDGHALLDSVPTFCP